MSVKTEDARDEAKLALYKAIAESVAQSEKDTADIRVTKLKDLAEAYNLVTYAAR
jgi:ribosomal protein L18E